MFERRGNREGGRLRLLGLCERDSPTFEWINAGGATIVCK
jgi:hypothetical protein